jgi:hypothetical protein
MQTGKATDRCNLLRRCGNELARWKNKPVGQGSLCLTVRPLVVRCPWQAKVFKDMCQGLSRDLFCLANDSEDLTLLIGCMATTGSYSKIPFLSWRFSALSSVTTTRRRCTSLWRATSGDVGLRPLLA